MSFMYGSYTAQTYYVKTDEFYMFNHLWNVYNFIIGCVMISIFPLTLRFFSVHNDFIINGNGMLSLIGCGMVLCLLKRVLFDKHVLFVK